jgi:hypothetical protein
MASGQLSAAIKACVSLDELAELYGQHGHSRFRSGHVSAALARLPHLQVSAHN